MEGFYVYVSSDASEKIHPGNTHAAFTMELATTIELDPRYKWSVALCEAIFPSSISRTYSGMSVSDHGKGPIFVYTDLVQTSSVGDSDTRILRIISPPNPHQNFIDRHYIPVSGERITQISILMTDRLAVKYPFTKSSVPIIMVLHFNPK